MSERQMREIYLITPHLIPLPRGEEELFYDLDKIAIFCD
jgi:hypothetical protein